jgi:hypothetical protein
MFENPDLPCERCKEREIACGPKIWGDKAEKDLVEQGSSKLVSNTAILFFNRPLPKPENSTITPLDDHYWQYFLFQNHIGEYNFTSFSERTRKIYIVQTSHLPRLVSSEIFRCAALAFASFFLVAGDSAHHSFLYLGQCYSRLRKALSGPVSMDLGYATYLLAKVAIRDADPLPHLAGFDHILNCFLTVPSREYTKWDVVWLKALYLDILLHFRCRIIHSTMDLARIRTQVRKVCNLLRSGTVEKSPAIPPFLEIKYFYFSAYFLLLLNCVGDEGNIGRARLSYR